MSLKTGGFYCRAPESVVRAAISKLIASAPKAAVPDAFVMEEHRDWTAVGVQGWAFGHSENWAGAISRATGAPAVGFCLLEGTMNYSVYNGGEYVGGQLSMSVPDPVLVGDVERMGTLLGVDAELLRDHCVGNPLGDMYAAADEEGCYMLDVAMDYIDEFRLRPSHKFAPWDEYAYINLIDDLGFAEFGLGDPAEIQSNSPESLPWLRSGDDSTKALRAYVFDPVAFRTKYGIRVPTESELAEAER